MNCAIRFRAACSCGWTGDSWSWHADVAAQAAHLHQDRDDCDGVADVDEKWSAPEPETAGV